MVIPNIDIINTILSLCLVPTCDNLNAPRNGYLTNTDDTDFPDNDTQAIKCNDGFTAQGTTSTVCMVNDNVATWMPDISSTKCGEINLLVENKCITKITILYF